ncbi:hypothetical protein HDF16_005205 [Granulicella aggregans]|uniref:Uncharacterized protein n=1 Tax=Granulicella aggregans TaxID=474949 RepID=A0A7W8E6L9_9BACT|nr:hypothetical protein [Granulicella aggregans]MBB5060469.1 hypothetical protein [Granulicella aggregans]
MITEHATGHPNGVVGQADVLVALDQILASRPFRTSNQCSGLLRYIVKHSLAGEDNLLRERVIGAELFGRPADYETSEDPVVRLRVSDVRKRLAQYYLSARDQREVQIEIPSGSYRATFHWNAEAPATRSLRETEALPGELIPEPDSALPTGLTIHPVAVEVAPFEATDVPLHSRRGARVAVAAGALLLLIALCVVALIHARSPNRAFRAFWAPWIGSSKPVLISIGSNAVYRFQWDYVDRYAREHGLEASGQEFYIPLKHGDLIPADELQPAYNSFVAIADVSAISDITTALTKQSVPFQERFPDDISFAELRSNPSVLVGGFNNPMTIELTKSLPFVMRSGSEIIETEKPNRRWALHIHVGSHDTADYAIVTRLAGNSDEPPLMSVAGLGGFGTQGAAQLVADPSAVAALVSGLPKGWERKNLQIVIGLKISDYKIVSREVVATRVW